MVVGLSRLEAGKQRNLTKIQVKIFFLCLFILTFLSAIVIRIGFCPLKFKIFRR